MALLEIDDVTVRFGGVTAVKEASLAFDDARITGLIGPNGAGKTTLFNVVTGLQAPTSGRVRFDGHDITRKSPHRRARFGIG
ncbi:MAG: ATP-binding cassette domain-containing protein, partial [Nocardioides sp.]